MDKRTVLIQLDSDSQPSVFDRVVAVDAGVDELFSYGGIKPEHVQGLVHGAIFTRHPRDLKRTALFVGGSDVAAGERLLQEALRHMIPQAGLRVSVLLDPNGANTTAAAAVHVAAKHLALAGTAALVLGGTGPVGQRVARLLAGQGAKVRVGSRQLARSAAVCETLRARLAAAQLEPVATGTAAELARAVEGQTLIVAAGAAGAMLLPKDVRLACPALRVAIDLNAVPPLGIEGVGATDAGAVHEGVTCYGAIGVGNTKMKIHRAAVARLFESNDQVLDAEEVFALARTGSAGG
jgi:hypothetical protein